MYMRIIILKYKALLSRKRTRLYENFLKYLEKTLHLYEEIIHYFVNVISWLNYTLDFTLFYSILATPWYMEVPGSGIDSELQL